MLHYDNCATMHAFSTQCAGAQPGILFPSGLQEPELTPIPSCQVFLLSIRTYWDHLDKNGYPISLNFASLLSKDAKTLLLSDIVLVSTTGLVVPVSQRRSRLPNHAVDCMRNSSSISYDLTVHEAYTERLDSLLLDWCCDPARVSNVLPRRRRRVDVSEVFSRCLLESSYQFLKATRLNRQWP